MTDTITPTTDSALGIELAPVSDQRPAMLGELARAEAALAAAREQIAHLEASNRLLRAEQITDGNDPRLVEFWERAGEAADRADFCREYDRLVDEIGGVARSREWSVLLDVTVTARVRLTVTARTEEEAGEVAEEELNRENVAEAIDNEGWDSISVDVVEAERE